jgi:hypothetical protein
MGPVWFERTVEDWENRRKMGKRGNGEGSISRRKHGGWSAQYVVYTSEGRKRRTLYGKTRAEVAAKLSKALRIGRRPRFRRRQPDSRGVPGPLALSLCPRYREAEDL